MSNDSLRASEWIYLQGERAPGGTYLEVGSSRKLHLSGETELPAGRAGCVACYILVHRSVPKSP